MADLVDFFSTGEPTAAPAPSADQALVKKDNPVTDDAKKQTAEARGENFLYRCRPGLKDFMIKLKGLPDSGAQREEEFFKKKYGPFKAFMIQVKELPGNN
jgi:hypothetical protein